jgi:hypothetical protein
MKLLNLRMELRQPIFFHLSPNNLTRYVRVCRKLKVYLTQTKALIVADNSERSTVGRNANGAYIPQVMVKGMLARAT